MSEKKSDDEERNKSILEQNYPLIVKFKDKCPGTFKHSQVVMDMVESVAQSLDIDPVDLKVAALYHDIGKLINPEYFSENQREDNPHHDLEPWMSFQIISRHVSDGILLLINEHDFSRKVLEIISQHHGTTVIRPFFNKSEDTNEDHWRYQSLSPSSIESAILMICDTIEATSQSMFQAHKEFDPKELIESKINYLLDDGQLDNVVMRLGDLKKIKTALLKELEGIFPKRVDYEAESEVVEVKSKSKKEKVRNGKKKNKET